MFFQNHGNVTRVQVHKGYCFVQFEKGTEAKAAIDKENGSMLLGKRIDVKTAVRNTNKQEQPNDNSDDMNEMDQKSIDSSNKGFAMLAKMGYKAGESLGKSNSGRIEPIPIEVKNDRGGLGKIILTLYYILCPKYLKVFKNICITAAVSNS